MTLPVSRFLPVFKKRFLFRHSLCNLFARRCFADDASPQTHFRTFEDMITFRRLQAKRSALIGVKSDTSINEVLTICQRHGTLTKKIVFHSEAASEHKLVFLVEYAREEELRSLLGSCGYSVGGSAIPVFSRILNHSSDGNGCSLASLLDKGCVEYENPKPNNSSKRQANLKARDQIAMLFVQQKLSDLGSRLRFLFCAQIEDSLSGLMPTCQVLPFGSTVNGFGFSDCDLDAFLNIRPQPNESVYSLNFQTSNLLIDNARVRTQVTLEVLGDFIQSFFPCVSSVQRILRARVPILKMHHTITGIDCDVSVSNGTGYYMSELLFLLGELDSRVRPLVFAVRHWARCSLLTRDSSGPWITNFSLTLMVLFFLQSRSTPILPTVQLLREMAGPKDKCIFDGVDCTFKRNFDEIPRTTNTDEIRTLLRDFFHFCNEMNWKEEAVSLVTGRTIAKPHASAIFIQNPIEPSLNVSKNVTPREADRFRSCVGTTLQDVECNWNDKQPFSFINAGAGDSAKSQVFRGVNVRSLFQKPGKQATSEAKINARSADLNQSNVPAMDKLPTTQTNGPKKDVMEFNLNLPNASKLRGVNRVNVENLFDLPRKTSENSGKGFVESNKTKSNNSLSRDLKVKLVNLRQSSNRRKHKKQQQAKHFRAVDLWKML